VDSRITTTGTVIALFGLLGIGVGLASFIVINQMTTAGSNGEQNMGEAFAAAIVILQSVGFLYFIGPAMATITALLSSRSETRLYSALTNGVGSFVGLLAFLILIARWKPLASAGGGNRHGGEQPRRRWSPT
jgi:hypothetical protein